jgi:hypothetical protein
MTSSFSSSIALSPTVTTVYTLSGSSSSSGCAGTKEFTVYASKCLSLYEQMDQVIRIYPNPVSERAVIQVPGSYGIKIYNQLSQKIYDVPTVNGMLLKDVTQLQDGVYTVEIQIDTHTFYRKLLVRH